MSLTGGARRAIEHLDHPDWISWDHWTCLACDLGETSSEMKPGILEGIFVEAKVELEMCAAKNIGCSKTVTCKLRSNAGPAAGQLARCLHWKKCRDAHFVAINLAHILYAAARRRVRFPDPRGAHLGLCRPALNHPGRIETAQEGEHRVGLAVAHKAAERKMECRSLSIKQMPDSCHTRKQAPGPHVRAAVVR